MPRVQTIWPQDPRRSISLRTISTRQGAPPNPQHLPKRLRQVLVHLAHTLNFLRRQARAKVARRRRSK